MRIYIATAHTTNGHLLPSVNPVHTGKDHLKIAYRQESLSLQEKKHGVNTRGARSANPTPQTILILAGAGEFRA